jgi:hypothetical protein
MENSENRAAIVMRLLEMKDTVVTQGGVFPVDSFMGERRNDLKDELYQLLKREPEECCEQEIEMPKDNSEKYSKTEINE